MYDYGLSVMEQYDLEVKTWYRGRGALLCQTGEGLFLLREFKGSAKRLEGQQQLLAQLDEQGLHVDLAVSNKEGSLISKSKDDMSYVLRRWYEGRECDTKSREDILLTAGSLADLHNAMYMPVIEDYVEESLYSEYQRHNRELRKIQRFIRGGRINNDFQRLYLSSVGEFLEWGEEAVQLLKNSGYHRLRCRMLERGSICHGEFNQHHVLMEGRSVAVTGFDKWKYDLPVWDLYFFMRKILEKSNWNISLGRQMLKAYDSRRPLSEEELENLKIRFMYPEKYWKLANYYYTHNKAWISEKNVEKLQILIEQKNTWREFSNLCFDTYN